MDKLLIQAALNTIVPGEGERVELRLLVLVKQVPTTENVKMDQETGTMVRTAMEAVINPLDLYAVEEAVRIKEESDGDVQVSVLSMGPPMAADAVREAIAMGCDEGFLISGKEFAGADTWATAYALAKGIIALGEFDIVLCGERATDGETGQVGPMVGTFLDIPVLTYISGIDRISGEEIVACRAIEGGMNSFRLGCLYSSASSKRSTSRASRRWPEKYRRGRRTFPCLARRISTPRAKNSVWAGHRPALSRYPIRRSPGPVRSYRLRIPLLKRAWNSS